MTFFDRIFGTRVRSITQDDVDAAPVPSQEKEDQASLGRMLIEEQASLATERVEKVQYEIARIAASRGA